MSLAPDTMTVCRLHGQDDLRVEDLALDQLTPGTAIVKIARGGICGSDLHYYTHGGFGPVRVKEPIILGHEIAGIVEQVDDPSGAIKVGDRVAVNPSQPCLSCHFCKREEFQHCVSMRFLGSARTLPHVQGGFRTQLVIPAKQCVNISEATSLASAACAEPLAVCLHAARQAGHLRGQRVLVTGAGPIGALCIAVAARQGAEMIIATDISDFTLETAMKMGASETVNVATSAAQMDRFKTPPDGFDVVLECSAAQAAIAMAIDCVRPRGTIVQVGVAGSLPVPINALVGKEITFKGTHRFHQEFAEAVALIDQQLINVEPVLTHTFPLRDAREAFSVALDRSKAIKVQLAINA
ncbi:MAG: L-idonate 5-dehydrogenase [Hyphomicrobiales bacterium]